MQNIKKKSKKEGRGIPQPQGKELLNSLYENISKL